jgi:hypothetical protein
LFDIRELGRWEQDADVVIGLYRDELVNDESKEPGMLELSVLKNRHSGQRPPFVAKAVWVRGLYREWSGNNYSDRTRIPRAVADAFDPPGMPPLPFRD